MKEKMETGTDLFRTEKIPRILLKIAPPVMLAQLIQAVYNIVDSFFVGQYSANSLTALSVIYPLQLIIIALAVGTGVGVNTYMARQYAQKFQQKAEEAAGTGMVLEFMTWLIFAVLAAVFMRPYHDKREVSGGDRGRGDLRADRLHRQYWRVFRGKLNESTPVQGKYAAPDDRPDRWRAD